MMQVKKVTENAILPEKAHDGDMGYDIFSNEEVVIEPNSSELIGTGIAVKMPSNWGLFIKDRSSYAAKLNLETAAGVIDNGYRNEIKVVMRNHGDSSVVIQVGNKIAQLIPIEIPNFEIEHVEEFHEDETSRNLGGFGSTGNSKRSS